MTFGKHAIDQMQRRFSLSRADAIRALTEVTSTIGLPDHEGEYRFWWQGLWLVCIVRNQHICTVWPAP